MEIREGNLGRVIVVRFDDGEDLAEGVIKVAKDKNIKAGVAFFIGALRKAEVVAGPKEPVIPPEPFWYKFSDGREIAGIGTIFWMDGEPKLHLHSTMGREEKVVLGCIRKQSEIFLTVEAVILEILNVNIERKQDTALGIARLFFGKEF